MTKDTTKRGCGYCNKIILGSSYSFKAHLFQHNAIEPRYECKVCLKPYYRKDSYVRHMNNHLAMGQITNFEYKYTARGYICDYCERSFKDKRNLVNHLKVHDDSYHTVARKYKCDACPVAYYEERLLKHHIRKAHFNLECKTDSRGSKKVNESWVEPLHASKGCVLMTKIKNNVVTIKRCDVKVEADTDVKSQVFDFEDLNQYSKVICDYCNKSMLKKSLKAHIKERHLKLRRFACETCKRTFKRHYQMVKHDCKRVSKRKKD